MDANKRIPRMNFDLIPKDFEKDLIPDEGLSEAIGFTSDKFRGILHIEYNMIYWCAESVFENVNHINELFDNIEAMGFTVVVLHPSEKMTNICITRNMNAVKDSDDDFERFYSSPKAIEWKPFCQCLHEIENKLPRTRFCFVACDDQYEILRRRNESK